MGRLMFLRLKQIFEKRKKKEKKAFAEDKKRCSGGRVRAVDALARSRIVSRFFAPIT